MRCLGITCRVWPTMPMLACAPSKSARDIRMLTADVSAALAARLREQRSLESVSLPYAVTASSATSPRVRERHMWWTSSCPNNLSSRSAAALRENPEKEYFAVTSIHIAPRNPTCPCQTLLGGGLQMSWAVSQSLEPPQTARPKVPLSDENFLDDDVLDWPPEPGGTDILSLSSMMCRPHLPEFNKISAKSGTFKQERLVRFGSHLEPSAQNAFEIAKEADVHGPLRLSGHTPPVYPFAKG